MKMLYSSKIVVLIAAMPFLLYTSMRFCSTSLFHQLSKPFSILFGRMAEVENCIFCGIVRAEDPEKLIYKDEDLVAFKDIKPAATHHYLIVTRKHIKDAKQLTSDDKPLVEKMISAAENILKERGANMSDVRLGFHWPPFNTIQHLHLHAISPVSEMSLMQSVIFRPGTWWFVSTDYVLSNL